MPKSWEQILGGYATDTLTEEEKRQLFEAALHDQTLFDALADEEALKALLADPEARHRILAILQSGNPQETATSQSSWLSWCRRPSSLAWAGSIAAMGLALIFGWQMEKDWGPMVRQEQPVESSVSEGKDKVAFRSQQSPLKDQKPPDALEKKDKDSLLSEEKPQSVLRPIPEASSRMVNDEDRLRQVQAKVKKERRANGEELDSLSPRMQEQIPQTPNTFSEPGQPQVEPAVQPMAIPDTVEVVMPAAATPTRARERFADQSAVEEPLLPPGALDLFYADLGAETHDSHAVRADADSSTSEKTSAESSVLKAKENNSVSIQGEITGGDAVIRKAKGIRYSFIWETNGKEQELADGQQITGDWRDVHLAIESNEAGFLYVLAPIGRGKWQQLKGTTRLERSDDPEDGKVRAYQVVEFYLGVITNTLGKLVISSFTVLLSPTPLENLGPWLVGNGNVSELQIERTDDSVYVVRPGLASESPLRVDIILEE